MQSEKERCEIYYRTSDREDWSLLGVVSADLVVENVNKRIDMTNDEPLPMQRYQFTKLPNMDALPEFNEIQFKYKLFNGFSIIGSWFDYEYTTRNTKQ